MANTKIARATTQLVQTRGKLVI
ncbi:uncharacterized protein METZ01_LOCUS93352 [marine metagenome]|uniref:Uncharacterized protein n=1 Tax=marine metagenome TaxID=408172 RepID=A0A381VL56_9ZZZZ